MERLTAIPVRIEFRIFCAWCSVWASDTAGKSSVEIALVTAVGNRISGKDMPVSIP